MLILSQADETSTAILRKKKKPNSLMYFLSRSLDCDINTNVER